MVDNKEYYEFYNWDEANLSNKLKEKINLIKAIIPDDVKTVLDIGCGDGAISNTLSEIYGVVATDRSLNSLKYVNTLKHQSSADNLPHPDNSFDLVFSSEMLEHLPDEIFYNAIDEIKRVGNKYVLLTFPNNENLDKHLIECPQCNTRFNKSYHLRNINLKRIQTILSNYKLLTHFTVGTKVRNYNKFLSTIKHRFSPPSSWIPNNWTPEGRRSAMCPSCSYKFRIPYRFHPFAFVCDGLNTLISPKKPYQLCVLFEKL